MAYAASHRPKAVLLAAAGVLLPLILGLLALAAFPWGLLRATAEGRFSVLVGAPVTIAGTRRLDSFSFHPLVELVGVRVRQPAWAGPGDLARIGRARMRFSAWAALRGHPAIEALEVEDGALAIVRDSRGRQNIGGDGPEHRRIDIRHLVVRDALVSYRDARQGRAFAGRLQVGEAGLRFAGTGAVLGRPVRVTARGAPIGDIAVRAAWPFEVSIEGPAVGLAARGTLDRPLDIDHLTAAIVAHGDDLNTLDALLEGGLPTTQPVRFTAHARRDFPDWTITGLAGRIGRSDVTGHLTIRKRDGRIRVDGALASRAFDFDDLSNAEDLRKAAAKLARLGPRLVPDTPIDLTKLAAVDGRLDVAIASLLWTGPSPFRSLRGSLDLDHGRLTVSPLVIGMSGGSFAGKIWVDQRRGGPVLTTALTLDNARLVDIFPGLGIDGRMRGRVDLKGVGKTVRAAVAGSSGLVAVAGHDGVIPARTASLLGQDVGRAATTRGGRLATLRCVAARFAVRDGIARVQTAVIDTTRAQTRATGTVDLRDESLHLALAGAPKAASLLRLPGRVPVAGTIKLPRTEVPARATKLGGVLKMLGRAITGTQGALATDANCPALEAAVLR